MTEHLCHTIRWKRVLKQISSDICLRCNLAVNDESETSPVARELPTTDKKTRFSTSLLRCDLTNPTHREQRLPCKNSPWASELSKGLGPTSVHVGPRYSASLRLLRSRRDQSTFTKHGHRCFRRLRTTTSLRHLPLNTAPSWPRVIHPEPFCQARGASTSPMSLATILCVRPETRAGSSIFLDTERSTSNAWQLDVNHTILRSFSQPTVGPRTQMTKIHPETRHGNKLKLQLKH